MNVDSDHARKALVALVIEKALLRIGRIALDQVSNSLYEEHHCYLGDYYEHPEYLAKALKDLFGKNPILLLLNRSKRSLQNLQHMNQLKDFSKRFQNK